MNIAIFGGSFDPPHIGHEAIVNTALKELKNVDKIIVVPTYLNPFKSNSHFSSEIRLELIKKLFKDQKKVKVCDYEVKSQRSVPTVETVLYLKKKYNTNKIFLIIGADNFSSIHLWDNYQLLKKIVKFVVVTRKNHKIKGKKSKIHKIMELDFNISSTKLRDNRNLKYVPKKIYKKVNKLWKKESKK